MDNDVSKILTNATIIDGSRRELFEILQDLDIPIQRRDVTNHQNLRWLNRNLMINNSPNSQSVRAKDLIKLLLRRI